MFLITRQLHFGNLVLSLFAAAPILFHVVPVVWNGRVPKNTLIWTFLWLPAGLAVAFASIAIAGPVASLNYYPNPFLLITIVWSVAGLTLPLISRRSFPVSERSKGLIRTTFLAGIGAMFAFAVGLSGLISTRAYQHAGSNACIEDTYGERYRWTLWAPPIRFLRTDYKGGTNPYLVLYDRADGSEWMWSFRNLDFISIGRTIPSVPSFWRNPNSKKRC